MKHEPKSNNTDEKKPIHNRQTLFAYVTNSTCAIVHVTSTMCAVFHFNLPHCDCMMSPFISKLIKNFNWCVATVRFLLLLPVCGVSWMWSKTQIDSIGIGFEPAIFQRSTTHLWLLMNSWHRFICYFHAVGFFFRSDSFSGWIYAKMTFLT